MAQPPANLLPVTDATVQAAYDYILAPWVKDLGPCELSAGKGSASARLPLTAALKFSSGAVCGQAIMAAIDTVVSLAMATTDRASKGTIYQHTHFLRPAVDDDFRIEATVLRFGKATTFAEARLTSFRAVCWSPTPRRSSRSDRCGRRSSHVNGLPARTLWPASSLPNTPSALA